MDFPEYDQEEVDVVQERSLLINEVRRRAGGYHAWDRSSADDISISCWIDSELREEDSKRAQTQIARSSGQYWGQRVAKTERDEWITTALADAYAMYYVRAAFGPEEHDARVNGIRNL